MDKLDAIKLLDDECTCVLYSDDTVYTFTEKGISPLLNTIKYGINVESFALADKIVGKAVAMLATKLKLKEVYANIISESAVAYLTSQNIPFEYKSKTDYIINRKGDGMCPMEETVKDIDDLDNAISKLFIKLESLKNNTPT